MILKKTTTKKQENLGDSDRFLTYHPGYYHNFVANVKMRVDRTLTGEFVKYQNALGLPTGGLLGFTFTGTLLVALITNVPFQLMIPCLLVCQTHVCWLQDWLQLTGSTAACYSVPRCVHKDQIVRPSTSTHTIRVSVCSNLQELLKHLSVRRAGFTMKWITGIFHKGQYSTSQLDLFTNYIFGGFNSNCVSGMINMVVMYHTKCSHLQTNLASTLGKYGSIV